MKKSVRYHPRFADDVVGAASWYESQSKPLADAFVKRVAEAVERLVRDPDRRGPGQFGVRYWPLRQFPFVIFYDVTALPFSSSASCIPPGMQRNGFFDGDRSVMNEAKASVIDSPRGDLLCVPLE